MNGASRRVDAIGPYLPPGKPSPPVWMMWLFQEVAPENQIDCGSVSEYHIVADAELTPAVASNTAASVTIRNTFMEPLPID